MRLAGYVACCGVLGVVGTAAVFHAKAQMGGAPAAAAAGDGSRSVAGGGITVPGWQGKVDADSDKAGLGVKDAKFAPEGKGFRITTGPAIGYWNPKNTAKGDYTVSATFSEPKFMNLNSHPHPYGVFIAGNEMGTDKQTYIYCAAYGNGNFIVRGFGPDAFQMNGRRGEMNAAVHKAPGVGEPVDQTIAMSVKGGDVSCSINGTVVATYPKADVVATGKLGSTDGVYGVRSAHNTDVVVTDLKVTK